MSKPYVSVILMVRTEEDSIVRTLDSVKDVASSIIVMDTDPWKMDETPKVIKDWCKENGIKLYLYGEPFRDFSTAPSTICWQGRCWQIIL